MKRMLFQLYKFKKLGEQVGRKIYVTASMLSGVC